MSFGWGLWSSLWKLLDLASVSSTSGWLLESPALMHRPSRAAALTGAFLLKNTTGQNVIDLGKANWTISDPGQNVSVAASLPSQAHLDLFAAGVISDPYYGLNGFDLRWVANSNWTYSAHVTGL